MGELLPPAAPTRRWRKALSCEAPRTDWLLVGFCAPPLPEGRRTACDPDSCCCEEAIVGDCEGARREAGLSRDVLPTAPAPAPAEDSDPKRAPRRAALSVWRVCAESDPAGKAIEDGIGVAEAVFGVPLLAPMAGGGPSGEGLPAGAAPPRCCVREPLPLRLMCPPCR